MPSTTVLFSGGNTITGFNKERSGSSDGPGGPGGSGGSGGPMSPLLP